MTTPRTDRLDQEALDRFLAADRDAGRTLAPAVVDAFERLTPRQLDLLVARLTDDGEAGPQALSPASAPGPVRRWLTGPGRTLVALGVAFVAATATAVTGIALVEQSTEPPAAASNGSSTSSQVAGVDDLARQLSWADAYGEAFADDF